MGNDILRAGNKCSFVLCISKIKNFSSSPSCTSNMVFFRGARERFFLVYQNCLCTKVNWNSIRFFCYSSYHGMMQLIFNSTLVVLRGNFQLCLGDNICLTTAPLILLFLSIHSIFLLNLEFILIFLFYQVETNKIFLRDTSVISPYSILLFGGSIHVQHQVSFFHFSQQ